MWDLVLTDCHAATMVAGKAPYGAIRDAVIAVKDGAIGWVGPRADFAASQAAMTRSLGGAWVTPGLVDCHTHLVFGGNRASEWAKRLAGESYEDIARAGGGILSTVRLTRETGMDTLAASAEQRLGLMAAQGVTTVEIKSGYGLDVETELKILRVAGRLGEASGIRVVRTLLAAHALPPEFQHDRDSYLRSVCESLIPTVARERLADSVDGFCERIAFTPAEIERVFVAARAHGLSVKLHADQLSDLGGAALAARFAALSADHLEHASMAGLEALAKAGSVAVLLPGAFYFLRETKKPPVETMRKLGIPIAIASDCNPGTSPLLSPLMVLNLACTLLGLTPEEALTGMTRNAAKALSLERVVGVLAPGLSADLAVWEVTDPSELGYWIGGNPLVDRYVSGQRNLSRKETA